MTFHIFWDKTLNNLTHPAVSIFSLTQNVDYHLFRLRTVQFNLGYLSGANMFGVRKIVSAFRWGGKIFCYKLMVYKTILSRIKSCSDYSTILTKIACMFKLVTGTVSSQNRIRICSCDRTKSSYRRNLNE